MEPQKQIVVFLAEFDFQVSQIESIYRSLKIKAVTIEKQRATAEAVESAGYWMHNLYCAFEDLFKLVAGFWEQAPGNVIQSEVDLGGESGPIGPGLGEEIDGLLRVDTRDFERVLEVAPECSRCDDDADRDDEPRSDDGPRAACGESAESVEGGGHEGAPSRQWRVRQLCYATVAK